MPKETKALLKIIERQGFTWRFTGKNHILVKNAQNRTIAISAGTPGNVRSIKNFRADLRRGGVTLD